MSKEVNRFPKILKKGLLTAVEAIASPEIRRKWAGYLITGMAVLLIAQTVWISWLIPNKEYIPYFLVEQADGSVKASDKIGKRFVASDVNKVYFLSKLLNSMFTIDEQTRFELPKGAVFLKGAALTQWKEFVTQVDRPIARLQMDSTLRRSIRYDGNFEFFASDDISGSVTVFFILTTKGKNILEKDKVKRYKMRMDYAMLPVTDSETILKNPIGIYVTNFGLEHVK